MSHRAPRSLALATLSAAVYLAGPSPVATAASRSDGQGSAAVLSTEPSIRRAREALVASLAAHGGPAEIRAAGGLVVELRGTRDQGVDRQGRSPGSVDRVPYRETLALDPAGDRLAREYRYDRYDGTFEWLAERYLGEEERQLLVLQDGFAVWLRSPEHAEARRRFARRLPQVLVAEVLERAAALRWLGRGEGSERVSAALADGTVVTLLLDAESRLLERVELLTDVQTRGDTLVAWGYGDYRQVAGIGSFPHRVVARVAGRPFLELAVERVATGAGAVAAVFALPEGIDLPAEPHVLPPVAEPAARATVREEASGVFTVRHLRTGFHPLFVDLGDCVLAVDAPAGYRLLEELPPGDVAPGPSSAWLSERFLELIGETVPGTPVCWAVLTHFHGDHAGGARSFAAAGATLLAPPGDVAAVERLLAAPHTVAPDRLTREPREVRVEAVGERRVLGEGERRVEVLAVGENPHTEEMLAVYLPELRYLFVSDLLTPAPLDDFPTPSHAELDRWFVGWLDASGLEAERVYTMHGTGVATREHLEKLRGSHR